VLRGGREGLAALLEAVLGDPLVLWGGEREAAAARRSLDVAVALNLLVSRWVGAASCATAEAEAEAEGWGG
jgi:hypothetical protein